MNPAPEFAAWTIVRQSIPGLDGQPPEAVIKAVATATKPDSMVSVIKTGLVRHQATTRKTSGQEDMWYEHGNRIIMTPTWKIPMFERSVSLPNQPTGPDFPDLVWISPKNFVGSQDAQGATFFIFEADIAEGDAKSAKEYGYKQIMTHNRAYINADTRLPWLLQTGDTLQRYVFQAAPSVPLDVPPEYQKMFDDFEKRKAEAAKKPMAP